MVESAVMALFSKSRRARLLSPVYRVTITTDVVSRATLALLTLYPPYAAYSLPGSVPGRMAAIEGLMSLPFFSLMIAVSLAIFADVLVNSVPYPPRLRWSWLADQRGVLYGLAAFCALVAPYSAAKFSELDPAARFLYLVIFFNGVGLLWCDAAAKRETRCGTLP